MKNVNINGFDFLVSKNGDVKLKAAKQLGLYSIPGNGGSDKKRYMKTTIMKENVGVVADIYIHEIVCTAFHGKRPSPDHQVNHIDGNPLNNHPNNLEWLTRSENIRHGLNTKLKGLNKNKVLNIRSSFTSVKPKSKKFNKLLSYFSTKYKVTKASIKKVINKNTWTWI
jgi:hypothetical protein